ncbi:hypothetical protein L1987_14881 [Smallanthus sonchifolius]|uniref:Uncharacterized protein n=1 Tax=Smallanthus sonchifolius TaxID=185202 RepID=A0ACB9J698_9ASTR|nr:hypothetical protein L1987_14881 [Smallanthus sonchifolius]
MTYHFSTSDTFIFSSSTLNFLHNHHLLPPQPPFAATTICCSHNHHPQPLSAADTLNLPPKSTLAEKSIKIQDCRFDSHTNSVDDS